MKDDSPQLMFSLFRSEGSHDSAADLLGSGDSSSRRVLSVGLLTYNSLEVLSDTLAALASQTLPYQDWELLILDHDSQDGTEQLLRDFAVQGLRVRRFSSQENNLARSRQVLVEASQAEWFVFIDSDVVLPRHWLETALREARAQASRSERFTGLGGPLRLKPRGQQIKSLPLLQSHFLGHFASEQMFIPHVSRRVTHLPTAAAVFRREDIIQAGGFLDEFGRCGEDLELGERLSRAGRELWMHPALTAEHRLSCTTLRAWVARSFRFGRARVQVAKALPHLFLSFRLWLPPAFVFVQFLALGVLATLGLIEIWLLLQGAYVCIIFACFMRQYKRQNQDQNHWAIHDYLNAAFLAWLTQQSYAWGQCFELSRLGIAAVQKKANEAFERCFFRRADQLEDLALRGAGEGRRPD